MVRTDFKQDLNIWQLERAICSGKTFVNCNSTLKFELYKNQELWVRWVENCKLENVPTFLSLLFKSMWINYKALIDWG